jgi:hypothetical protein
MKKGELIYLAAPYTHKKRSVMVYRFRKINKAAAIIMGKGYYLYSPISHTHPIADAGELPRGWDFWGGYDEIMISACKVLVVLMLDGWKESTGVNAEIKIAQRLGLPIEYISPDNPQDWPFY